jgi:RNA polymerase sigma-70 factor (ECF subfamily)
VVLAAREEGSSRAAGAMDRLCRTYWRPVYAYVRRQGHNRQEAEDLTQGFFTLLLEKDYLQHLRHQEGKFRSFLLTLVKHFLSDERDKASAQKRGGDKTFVSLDETSAEESYLSEQANGLTPDQSFERRWAQTVMDRALGRLRSEYVAGGKEALFEQLKDILPGEHGESSYAEIGARLGLAKGTIASAVHRLRKRYGEILREEIAQTVARPEEIDEEIRSLLTVLSR